MKYAAILVTALILAICGLTVFTSHPEAQVRNAVGKVMPTDAAPPDRQVFRFLNDEPTNLDIGVAIYEVGGIVFLFERLTMLDHNNRVIPGAASEWTSSEDQTRWTFQMRPGARWSDGRPVTAHDFEYSYKRMLDPRLGQRVRLFLLQYQGRPGVQHGAEHRSELGGRVRGERHDPRDRDRGPVSIPAHDRRILHVDPRTALAGGEIRSPGGRPMRTSSATPPTRSTTGVSASASRYPLTPFTTDR